jgi:hypothetical protein
MPVGRLKGALVLSLAVLAPVESILSFRVWLTDREIAEAFSGATLEGSYASGRTFIEHYRASGRVEYAERDMTTAGRWSVTAGSLCTIYDPDPSGGCFRVMRVGENCYEFYFASRTEAEAPGDRKPAWTARGSITGKPGGCRDGATV